MAIQAQIFVYVGYIQLRLTKSYNSMVIKTQDSEEESRGSFQVFWSSELITKQQKLDWNINIKSIKMIVLYMETIHQRFLT